MCGIFALLNNNNNLIRSSIYDEFNKGKHRGPENSVMEEVTLKTTFGFHRLAINGLNEESNQPLRINNIVLICNGEIYNYKELYKMMNVKPITNSDCEVIIHLYIKYGIEQTLQMLDGVFAFSLLDNRNFSSDSKIYFARDPYGVRPLYMLKYNKQSLDTVYGFSSELKQLTELCNTLNKDSTKLRKNNYNIYQFPPGTFCYLELPFKTLSYWKIVEQTRYSTTGFTSCNQITSIDSCIQNIQKYLQNAVSKRCSTTDRPIACLLSGGLDSSLISALVNEYHKKNNLPTLETYSIGLEGAEDLKYAKSVADYLGTKHTEIILTEEEFLNAIPNVIKDIESYDTTTVRASIGNWLIGKYISENSKAKVIFNGDGSDELTGGYLYVGKAPNTIEFDKECRRLLKDIHMFDVLRSDKCISSHGLEPRTPFLDREWIQYYLSIPFELRNHSITNSPEKYLLRKSFDKDNFKNINNLPLLPDDILWRRKEAFSDGVSQKQRSLYTIIQEYSLNEIENNDYGTYFFQENITESINTLLTMHDDFSNLKGHLLPTTIEQVYYRSIFEKYYNGYGKILPYFWMPKYVNAKDSSARSLSIYNDNITL